MIYFCQCVDGGPIKIGYSIDVAKRLDQLEKYYGCQLALLSVMRGLRNKELQIHRKFKHLRLGRDLGMRKCEQYIPALELMQFIRKPLLTPPNPNSVKIMRPTGGGMWERCKYRIHR